MKESRAMELGQMKGQQNNSPWTESDPEICFTWSTKYYKKLDILHQNPDFPLLIKEKGKPGLSFSRMTIGQWSGGWSL